MRNAWTLLLALALLGPGLAGCIGNDNPTNAPNNQTPGETENETFVPTEPDYDFMDAIPVNHPDHQNPESHTASHGFSVKGHTDFSNLYSPEQQGGWTEVDLHEDLAAVASYVGFNGITLVDLSDPANPEPISLIPSAGNDYDARFSHDGNYLFFGCQPGTLNPQGVMGDCTSTTPGMDTGQTSGVVAYNVSDPANPTFAGFLGGVATHNIWTAPVNGDYYVFTNSVDILRFNPDNGTDTALQKVGEAPGTHDAFVHQHPVTQDWLLYTGSSEDDSFAIYNVSDPTDPQVLVNGGFDGVVGWHKQVASPTLIDGRVLLLTGGEISISQEARSGDAIPAISVIDVTDPTAPEPLSKWRLPVSELPPWVNYRWSPHNMDITPTGQVSIAWNHAGTWMFDLSTQDRQENPVTLGFFQPHNTPPAQPPTVNPTGDIAIPRVWGGMWDDQGHLVVPDMYTGLYVLEPDWAPLPS